MSDGETLVAQISRLCKAQKIRNLVCDDALLTEYRKISLQKKKPFQTCESCANVYKLENSLK